MSEHKTEAQQVPNGNGQEVNQGASATTAATSVSTNPTHVESNVHDAATDEVGKTKIQSDRTWCGTAQAATATVAPPPTTTASTTAISAATTTNDNGEVEPAAAVTTAAATTTPTPSPATTTTITNTDAASTTATITNTTATTSNKNNNTVTTPTTRARKSAAAAAAAAATNAPSPSELDAIAKKKRMCRFPGCPRVIKSQGFCQRHGARAKRCKVEGCEKQAQGTHDGMCKRHWRAVHFPEALPKPESLPPPPEGESVYDGILPQSIAYRPTVLNKPKKELELAAKLNVESPVNPPTAPAGVSLMPLVSFLRDGLKRETGWHRNAERRARGMFPVSSLSCQLEPWERQLALVEILLLSGGTPYANFKNLAHAWGREKGFHHVLANNVCERRGEVDRKRRSDAGKTMTQAERASFRIKLKKAKAGNNSNLGTGDEDMMDAEDDEEEEARLVPAQSPTPQAVNNEQSCQNSTSFSHPRQQANNTSENVAMPAPEENVNNSQQHSSVIVDGDEVMV